MSSKSSTNGGDTLLKRFFHSIQALSPVETLMVTGFYSEKIDAEINLLRSVMAAPIALLKNPHPELGQFSSVRLGLESLRSDYDVLIIALCDQLNIGRVELESLLEKFTQLTKEENAKQEIVLPIVKGQRGNPGLCSKKVLEQILEIPGVACRSYMDKHPELVNAVVTENEAYVLDVDTQADIQKLGLDPIESV
ncbi:NTP transferase domain-containing protein [Polynucleobacter necessarius]|uniref:nucleotidyltransferase family protein n=1 Tax=Polynucleobacter necessarius TaxID=576610 RepID=UPI000E09AFCA|nr:NTP transferase domain-containing protein [Polynucleobacter necessarius]